MAAEEQDYDAERERERAEEEADRLRKAEPPPDLSEGEFLAWRSPRIGDANPARQDNPLWNWMVRTRWSAYQANKLYHGPSSDAGPMWTFERFGCSQTTLPDGNIVYIGGEHEDYYDPDFFIYNDVTLIDPSGQIAICGYPLSVFPPTDFHSASLVGKHIYIIGGLGYEAQRIAGSTPVYQLSLDTLRMQRVQTHGAPPGWIYKHSATLADDGQTILISQGERWVGMDQASYEQIDCWAFNTQNGEWTRLTERNWQHWIVSRTDNRPSRLWDIRQALWHRENPGFGLPDTWNYHDEPDFAALDQLYRLPGEAATPEKGDDYGTFKIVIDGLNVRFEETTFWVEAIVEGQLEPERLALLQNTTLDLLARLEAVPCQIDIVPEYEPQTGMP